MLEEIIRINKNQVDLFNIPIKLKHAKDEVKIFIHSIQDTDTEIEIITEFFTIESEKPNHLKISYDKKDLTPQESIFVGWSYLSKYQSLKVPDDFYKNKAKQYLKSAIKNNAGSCLPHYLLGSPPLDYIYHPNLLSQMNIAIQKYKDAFPEFYSLIYENEKDGIKTLNILKEGLGKFPTNLTLNYHMSNLLIKKNDFKNALEYLGKAEFKDIKELNVWKYYIRYFYNQFICNIKLNNFIFSNDLLNKSKGIINESEILLLKGILRFEQERFGEASELFMECIKNDTDNVTGYCAHFYLLNCYVNLKDITSIEETAKNLPEKRISYYNSYFGFNFLEIAEKSLKKTIDYNLNEFIIAKISGLLASIIIFEKINIGNEKYQKQNLAESEIRFLIEAEKLIQKAVSCHPQSSFFQTVNSNILTLKEKYQECISDYLEKHKEDEMIIHEVWLEHPKKIIYYDKSSDTKQTLKKYNENSKNFEIMSYLFENQNTEITIEEIKKISEKKKMKSLHQVVRDLGFEEPLKDLFFKASDNTLEFRAAVKNKDLK